jgi:hypothetical protein
VCRLTRCWTGRKRRRLRGILNYDWFLLLLIDCCVQIDNLLNRKEKEKAKRELGQWLITNVSIDWLLLQIDSLLDRKEKEKTEREHRLWLIVVVVDWLWLLLIDCCCWWLIALRRFNAARQEGGGEDWAGAWTIIDCCCCWLIVAVVDWLLLLLIDCCCCCLIAVCRLIRCWTGRRRRRLSGSLDYDWLLLLLIDCCAQIDTLLDRKEKEKTEQESGQWLIAAFVDWLLCADWHAAGQEGEGEDWGGAWTMIDCYWYWLIAVCRLTRCWIGRRRRRLSGSLDYEKTDIRHKFLFRTNFTVVQSNDILVV